MVDKAACEKQEPAIAKKSGADTQDFAGDLSSSCWQKPEPAVASATPRPETSTKAEVSRLGFPEPKFDLSAGDNGKTAQATDAKNPSPETWKYDDKGNLLQAGDRVKASYDQQGNLKKVQVDDSTFERKGNDVVETYKAGDGEMRTHVNKDVASFKMRTEDADYKGAYKNVIVEAGGGHTLSSKVWESAEHTAAIDKIWQDQQQRNLDVANSTPDSPHPDTWKYGPGMKVLEAGNKFSAEYDEKTGELLSAKMGDDEWKRGPNNTVIETHTRKDGTTSTEIYKGVRSFTADAYGDNENGLLAGMRVTVADGETSESSRSVPIYQNEERINWSNGKIKSMIGKLQD